MDERDRLAYHTLGRIRAILEMFANPKVYRMTPERTIELIRAAMADFREPEADRG